jgi:hypothetical protein
MSHGFVIAAACLTIAATAAAAQPTPFAEQTTTVTPAPLRRGIAQETTPRPGQSGPTLESLGMRGFSVALVLGEMQGTSSPDTLPAGAKRAITDMRDFLPYKSYRMLDASWTLCCAGRHGGVSGRLQGVDETEYSFDAWVQGVTGSKMSVTFRLREIQPTPDEAIFHSVQRTERERDLAELRRQQEAIEREAMELAKKNVGENHPETRRMNSRRVAIARQIEELRSSSEGTRRPSRTGSRPVMDTTFSMDVGETVVIGSSRLKGDKALIVLLTAASRTTGAREP